MVIPVILAFLFLAPSLGFADITTGLISLWEFEGDYTNSGGFTTTPVGNPAFVTGKVGSQQVDLDGNDYLRVTRSASLEPGNLTVAAWVDPGAAANWGAVICRPYSTSLTWATPFCSWRMARYSGTTYSFFQIAIAGVAYSISGASTGGTEWTSGGATFHMALTYDGSTLRGYVNGNLVSSILTPGGPIDYANQTDLAIGQRSPYAPGEYVTSGIDQLRIYSRALTTADIQELVNEVPSVPPPVATGSVAAPGGSGTNCTQSDPCAAQFALDQATAGDTVTLLDGTYGPLDIDQNSGTSGSRITLQALNRFGAVIDGGGANGLDVTQNWWVISGLKIRNANDGVNSSAGDNNIYEHMRILDTSRGMRFSSSSNDNLVRWSYIGPAFKNDSVQGLRMDGPRNILENSLVFGHESHKDAYTPSDSQGISVAFHSSSTTGSIVRGNIIGGADKDIIRKFDSANQIITDSNIFTLSSGGIGARDSQGRSFTTQHQHEFTNNLFRRTGMFTENKGNLNSDNQWRHNTFILDEFSNVGMLTSTVSGVGDQGQRWHDNGLISLIQGSGCNNGQKLYGHRAFNSDFCCGGTYGNNGYFKFCGSPSSWVKDVGGNFQFAGSDVLTQPTFVNESIGDFTAAAGSSWKGAGSGGSDIGIAYNSYLTLRKARLVHSWDSIENTGLQGSTSTSFSGLLPGDRYYVWFYHPTSGGSNGNVQFNIEGIGTNLARDLNLTCCVDDYTIASEKAWNGSARYLPLGVFAQDGTLNVTWNNSNAADRIYAARVPRDTEGHAWVYPQGYPVAILSAAVQATTPTKLAVTLSASNFTPALPSAGCSGFSLTQNGMPVTIASCTRTADNVQTLTLVSAVTGGTTLSLSYSGGNVESAALIPLAATPSFPVTNNVPGPAGTFVSPSGTGTECTDMTPCSLATGLSQAASGTTISFKDGTYGNFDTDKINVTYLAQNNQQAKIVNEDSHAGGTYAIGVRHSGSVIDGLHISGQADGDADYGGGSGHGLVRVFQVDNLTIQNALIEDSAGELVNFCGTITTDCTGLDIHDTTLRRAGMQTGGSALGECVYVCQFQGLNTCTNVAIYRNIFQQCLEQAIDIKPGGVSVEIYYNIFETQTQNSPGADPDGVFVDQSGQVNFHDNIVRNNTLTSKSGTSVFRPTTKGNVVKDNVVYSNAYTGSFLIRSRAEGNGIATDISDNVFCSNTGTVIESVFTNLTNNTFGTGTPAPDCTDKENDILILRGDVVGPPMNTYYIQPSTGTDSGGCGTSEGNACATWGFLNSEHTPAGGDTVCLLNPDGTTTLNEKIEITAANSGTSGSPLVIDGKCGSQVDRGIVDGTGVATGGRFALISVNNADWIVLNDLEVRNAAGTDERGIRIEGGSSNITIRRPKVHNNGTTGAASIGIDVGTFGADGGNTHLIEGSVPSNRWDYNTYDCQVHGNYWNNIAVGDSNPIAQRSTVKNCALWEAQANADFHSEKDSHRWTLSDNFFGDSNAVDEDSVSIAWGSNSIDCLAQGGGSQDFILARNIFTDVTPSPIVTRDYLGVNGCVTNLVIRNNIFSGKSPGMQFYAAVKNVKIYHNTLYVGHWGIRFWEMIDGLEMLNNIVVACTGTACASPATLPVHMDGNTRQCCQDNNHCLWQSNVIVADAANADAVTMDIGGQGWTTGGCPTSEATRNETEYFETQLATWEAAGWLGAASRTNDSSWGTEPLFVNPGGNDFALQSGDTIAKDQGQIILSVTTDFLGKVRDSTPDIGAFEFQGSPPPLAVTSDRQGGSISGGTVR